MNAPTKKTKAMLIATLLLGLGASALAGGAALPSTPRPATSSPSTPSPATPIQPTAPQTAAPGVTPQAPPAPLVPGQAGPGAARCAPGADMAMRPAPAGPGTTGRARPAPPAPGTAQPTAATPGTISAQPAAPKAPKGDRMDKGRGPKEKGMGKGDQGGKGEVCPPAPRGMERGQPQPGAAASGLATPNQAAPNPAPAARDLNRLDALAAQTSDARIRGYLNDARTYLQSASKAQQKAGRDLLHAAEALIRGVPALQR